MHKKPGVRIVPYTAACEAALFTLLQHEGDEWKDYWDEQGQPGKPGYLRALEAGPAYLLYEGEALCGYARCREDDGFGVYVYDLLVERACRGRQYGRLLMEQVCRDYPGQPVYVMSGVDGYYTKLGYEREGSIFCVTPPKE